jgi:hypothetical protein
MPLRDVRFVVCDLHVISRRLADGDIGLSPREPKPFGQTRLPELDCLWAGISLIEFGQESLLSTSKTLVKESAC